MTARLGSAAAVVAAVVLAALLMVPGLGGAPFDDPGEGQHAEIAREMAASGDWLRPRLNGVRYLDKPPLLYWLAAAALSGFGARECAARLVPALGTALAAAATAVLGSRLLGPAGGLFAAGALLSSTLFVSFGQYVRPETLFVAAIQWGFAGLCLGAREPERPLAGPRGVEPPSARGWSLLGGAALGAASLAKDPLGLFGPLAAVGLARALRGAVRPLGAWLPPVGIALLVVIGGGWYATMLGEPGFAWYTVVDNHLLNALRLRNFPDEDVPVSSLELLAISSLGAFPWVIAAAFALGRLVRRRAWRSSEDSAWTALGLWAVGVLGVVALVPFRLPHYALPVYPAVALLAARGWQDRPPRAMVAAHALLFACLAIGCAVVAASDGRLLMHAVLSTTDVYTRKEEALGQAARLPPWAALAPLFARAVATFGVASAALALSLRPRWRGLARWAVLGAMLATMPSVTAAQSAIASSRAVARMAAEVGRRLGPGDLLLHEGPIENSGALEFYSGHRPVLLEARRSVLGFGATLPESRETFWDAARFLHEWCGARRLLLVTPRDPHASLVARLPAGSARLLFADNGRRLYENTRSPACGAEPRPPTSQSPRATPPVHEAVPPVAHLLEGGRVGYRVAGRPGASAATS